MTKVINLYDEPYDVYIGRAGKGKDGTFGNPFTISETSNRESCIAQFSIYFYNRLKTDEEFRQKVLALKDKTLGCFCKPNACHGDIIARWLDGANKEEGTWD